VPDAAGDFASPARTHLAATTRALVDAVLATHGASEEELERAAADVERVLEGLAPRRAATRRSERTPADYLPRSPVVGRVSPLAPPLEHEVRDGGVHARGVFGAAYEGPPGYVHGGWIALAFDEVLGMANVAAGHRGAMTARLTVRYRRPTPLHTELRFESRVRRVDGRRLVTLGALHAGPAVTAEAEGLFVTIDADQALEYFGERQATPEPVDPLP